MCSSRAGHDHEMARIFITGSADGLGAESARRLVSAGHEVVLHARDDARVDDALAAVPGAAGGLGGDLASLKGTRVLAERADATGPFDVVIHNAGLYVDRERVATEDGFPRVLQVNVLAPYLLTALMAPAKRLIHLSSGLHRGGTPDLHDLDWTRRRWDGPRAYADSKLLDVLLAFAVSRRRPDVASCAVDPGWVRTKMGGPSAARDLTEGTDTQVWLAAEAPAAEIDGRYFATLREERPHAAAQDHALQDALLAACAERTGAELA